ncbi:hypothetical protein ASG43_05330 [Aureimonas sp. Leaf454]|uniref:hypothetical protein n=1 Tax=Aureimonas sp. Leaf454 TaxID=1736381 RepID=UPI0006FCC85A|nr:hypothetical protein [Aureimonas sp. Leaf454]KQT50705.1 hypothetical protein ASG43_05330 [Aureimonas sp. Leaf454]
MGQPIKPTPPTDLQSIEDEVDEAIAICGGDARRAVRGLILGQEQIRTDIGRTVSAGYVRRRPR